MSDSRQAYELLPINLVPTGKLIGYGGSLYTVVRKGAGLMELEDRQGEISYVDCTGDFQVVVFNTVKAG